VRLRKISIDEFSHRKGYKKFATVICDLEGTGLVEVIDSHRQEEIIKTLMEWSLEQRLMIEEVCVDMWGGFTKVIQEVFPNARITYDRFHVMKIVNEELDKIRKQCKNKIKKLKIKHIKYLLMKNEENLNEEQKSQVEKILACSPRLKNAYRLKEDFREIYETYQTPDEAAVLIQKWIEKASKFYTESIKTIQNHIQGICNYFYERVTSGMMEGINNKIKLIKRQAYGFTNFDHLRMRLLAAFLD
jgi:transposase